jgi:hypothetical protein
MLTSNLTGILVVFSNYKILGSYNSDTTVYPTSVFIWILVQGLTSIIRDASFNVAHWEFAFKYFTISYEVPLMLKGEETIDAPFLYSNFFYYSMVAFNCLVAVLSGIDFVIYNFAVFQLKDVSVLIVVCAEVLHFLIGLA